jgi:hypothetical protein
MCWQVQRAITGEHKTSQRCQPVPDQQRTTALLAAEAVCFGSMVSSRYAALRKAGRAGHVHFVPVRSAGLDYSKCCVHSCGVASHLILDMLGWRYRELREASNERWPPCVTVVIVPYLAACTSLDDSSQSAPAIASTSF